MTDIDATGWAIGLTIAAVINGSIGGWIGILGKKENGRLGILLGGLFGPIGWIITAILPARADGRESRADTGDDGGFPLVLGALGIATLVLVAGIVAVKFM